MARYVVLCDCTGTGYQRQIIGVIDDNRSEGRHIMFDGAGVHVNFKPPHPNRHGGFTEYRLSCPGCRRKVRWAENTAAGMLDRYAAKRCELEIAEIPATSEAGAKNARMLRSLRPEQLARLSQSSPWLVKMVRIQTDPEQITPGVLTPGGARYVIPFKDLCYRNSKRR